MRDELTQAPWWWWLGLSRPPLPPLITGLPGTVELLGKNEIAAIAVRELEAGIAQMKAAIQHQQMQVNMLKKKYRIK